MNDKLTNKNIIICTIGAAVLLSILYTLIEIFIIKQKFTSVAIGSTIIGLGIGLWLLTLRIIISLEDRIKKLEK